MKERQSSNRQRFEFFCPFGQEIEARVLLADIQGVRLVPQNKRQAVSQTIITANAQKSREGVFIRGVAATKETYLQTVHKLADAKIAGYSRETKVSFEESSLEQKRLRNESTTSIQFENGGLTIEHRWEKISTQYGEEWKQAVMIRSLLGDNAYKLLIHELYASNDRRQFFKLVRSLQERKVSIFRFLSGQQSIGRLQNYSRLYRNPEQCS